MMYTDPTTCSFFHVNVTKLIWYSSIWHLEQEGSGQKTLT